MTADEIGEVKDRDSSGWKHIFSRFKEISDSNPGIKEKIAAAKVGFDLGSGRGQSAYALSRLCPSLTLLHCVDNKKRLEEPFKEALQAIAVENQQSMQEFVAAIARKPERKADVVMISSMENQSFFKTEDLAHLASSMKTGGILFEYNSDFPLSYSETPMTEFFSPLHESRSVTVWQRK